MLFKRRLRTSSEHRIVEHINYMQDTLEQWAKNDQRKEREMKEKIAELEAKNAELSDRIENIGGNENG